MSCPIEIKAINRLKKEGIIDSTRRITNLNKFNKINSDLTEAMVDLYNLSPGNRFLFSVEERQIKHPIGGSYRRDNITIIYRAVPNTDIFKSLQDILDGKQKTKSSQPQLEINFPNTTSIVSSENPIEIKQRVDRLKEDKDELDNLMNCIWEN